MISMGLSGLKQTKWYELLLRFVLGGLVTAGAGLIGKGMGESFAGLFLAFPAILAASTTLVAKHERQKKEKHGQDGKAYGCRVAGADAIGAAMGSAGLIAFAAIVWQLVTVYPAWAVLAGATAAWGGVAACVWLAWKKHPLRRIGRGARAGTGMAR
ncbi:MAG: hypothetical protein ACTHN5_08120 [Phycisphaerae bacterium]